MNPAFRISKGDLPKITYTLSDDNGAVDLTGGTVKFNFQGAGVSFSRDAVIVTAAQGAVEYQMVAEDTAIPGTYQAQWVFTKTDVNRTFPTGSLDNDEKSGSFIIFEIVETVPIVAPASVTLISDTYECVRAILGDFNRHRRYEDTAIASVIRSCIRMGKLTGYSLTADTRGISPAIAQPKTLALLVYWAAKTFILPNAADYAYRTRALSERFGNQKHFLFDLENQIYDLATDGGVFHTFQSFYGWVTSTTGVDVMAMMTDMRVNAPVATVTLGRDGLQVSS